MNFIFVSPTPPEDVLVDTLNAHNHIVTSVTTVVQAEAMLVHTEIHCDCLILAVPSFPGINEAVLIREIRKNHPALPIVLRTAIKYPELRIEKCLDAGATTFITQGLPSENFCNALMRSLGQQTQ